MRPRAGWLLALCTAAGAVYAADIFVSTTGNDVTGDGSSGAPFRTVQHAVDTAQLAGDRIRVLAGTYNECVNAGPKSVVIVADVFITQPTPSATSTVIDGAGQCVTPTGDPAPTVLLGDDSALEGFTVKGGSAAGVQAFGDVVITKNEIRDNDGFQGGGIYLYAVALSYGTHLAVIDKNVIRNNTAEVDGGGVFAFAGAGDSLKQEVQITNNTIRNNVAQGFPLSEPPYPFIPGGFGGGVSAYTFSATLGEVEVAITQNLIEGNSVQANSGYFGSYGGGMWVSTLYGYGTETIRIADNNQVRNNTAVGTGGGISAWAQGFDTSRHTVQVEGNSVSGNGADDGGGGLDLFMRALDLTTGSLRVQVTSNELTGNRGDGFFGGGGLTAYSSMRRTDVPANEFSIRENTIRGNTTTSLGGGASLRVVADADPDQGGATATTASLVRFERNLVAGNRADSTANDAGGGGVAVELLAFGDARAKAELHFDTVASNLADEGGGGIEVRSLTEFDTVGTNEGEASFELGNSIVASNTSSGFGVNLAPPGPTDTGNLFLDFFYNDVFGNTVDNYENTIGNQTGTNGNISLDPKLDANFVPDVCSPTLDAADPAADFSLEPEPNGDRANQGHLGGTTEAVRQLPDVTGDGLVDGVEILRIASAFGSAIVQTPGCPTLQPARYFAPADLDLDGCVDGNDLSIVAAFYGRACP